jgi:hypothetical protein
MLFRLAESSRMCTQTRYLIYLALVQSRTLSQNNPPSEIQLPDSGSWKLHTVTAADLSAQSRMQMKSLNAKIRIDSRESASQVKQKRKNSQCRGVIGAWDSECMGTAHSTGRCLLCLVVTLSLCAWRLMREIKLGTERVPILISRRRPSCMLARFGYAIIHSMRPLLLRCQQWPVV